MRQLPLCPRGFVETSVWVGVGGGAIVIKDYSNRVIVTCNLLIIIIAVRKIDNHASFY